ncbi:SIR2 family protein [Rubinisphaera margarita]|uniref:SIR2 family protein n=1 Tax=Rubinisphaera margarita TaxID=2909586 RepID=UPI001EE9A92D|nr:SIR2 family protein [Rubinisphaera margarita]MCG6158322.1 SIR2 family protein [Rubinisphaera margarita]
MRFVENGPSIPDELLTARDEGRVVFFCGAGVSRAKAGLPDFFGLLDRVLQSLGASKDSESRVLYETTKTTISADSIFGALEADFDTVDIQNAVAAALRPSKNADVSAHDCLIRLARTPSSEIKLVTTNFDRLFEAAHPAIRLYSPSVLPHPVRDRNWDGLVYLHGKVNKQYSSAEGTEFVLSSADFGYAYLSEGWATAFVRETLREYVVVFIGYSADDPPVKYLLEGLNKQPGKRQPIYAFQSGAPDRATAKWERRGVTAIPYSDHELLWETIERWADRADDPMAWSEQILQRALEGPRNLNDFERGQIAHIVSTAEGARAFAEAKPPGEWLCVFDPACRFENVQGDLFVNEGAVETLPFEHYGLDGEERPEIDDSTSGLRKMRVPEAAWDAFAVTEADKKRLTSQNFAQFRGNAELEQPALPLRLLHLANWISLVATQSATIWWLARQSYLHPEIVHRIRWRLRYSTDGSGVLGSHWFHALNFWARPENMPDRDGSDLEADISKQGWTSTTTVRLAELCDPYVKIEPGLRSRSVPPDDAQVETYRDIAFLKVEVSIPRFSLEVSNVHLPDVTRVIRCQLEKALRLDESIQGWGRLHINSLIEGDGDQSDYDRKHGLSALVVFFAGLFKQLASKDIKSAKEEFNSWRSDDDTVFSRLRVWASGMEDVATPTVFGSVVANLSDVAFWSSDHERDFLLTLQGRWKDIPQRLRKKIERRLLDGPGQFEDEDISEYEERRNWEVIQRLQSLKDSGAIFSVDVDREIEVRRRIVPAWKPEHATFAFEPRGIRVGRVPRDTDSAVLENEPLDSLISRAEQLTGRSSRDGWTEREPFSGLCAENPKRAFLALKREVKKNAFPSWAWKRFLAAWNESDGNSALASVVGRQICHLPDDLIEGEFYSFTHWLANTAKVLSGASPHVYEEVAKRLTNLLIRNPALGRSVVTQRNRGRDWTLDALNSPAGHLVRALLDDARYETSMHCRPEDTFWMTQSEKLLLFSGDTRTSAITLMAHHLGWLYETNPSWTESYLLAFLRTDDHTHRDAFWAGILWRPNLSDAMLGILKDDLLELVKTKSSHGDQEGGWQTLSWLILRGWIAEDEHTGAAMVSNEDLREALLNGGDDFRSHVLWQFSDSLARASTDELSDWQERAVELFQNAWPKQKIVKSSLMTSRILDVLLANEVSFAAIFEPVFCILTPVINGASLHFNFRTQTDKIIERNPEEFLAVLNKLFRGDVQSWPFGLPDTLSKIELAAPALRHDKRLVDLRRRVRSS